MGVEYKIEISVPEPDARRIIAEKINEMFFTSFEAKDVRVRYVGGYGEQEFGGFYIWHYKDKSTKPKDAQCKIRQEGGKV